MKTPALWLGVVAVVLSAALSFCPRVAGGDPIPGQFLLKFAYPVDPGGWYPNPQGYLMTGIASIDTLNVQYHVVDLIPVFYPLSTDPEIRAHEEEAGLDRIFLGIMDPVFDPDSAAQDYGADPNTDYAETNEPGVDAGVPQHVPNDEYFGRQWALHNTGQTGARLMPT